MSNFVNDFIVVHEAGDNDEVPATYIRKTAILVIEPARVADIYDTGACIRTTFLSYDVRETVSNILEAIDRD